MIVSYKGMTCHILPAWGWHHGMVQAVSETEDGGRGWEGLFMSEDAAVRGFRRAVERELLKEPS